MILNLILTVACLQFVACLLSHSIAMDTQENGFGKCWKVDGSSRLSCVCDSVLWQQPCSGCTASSASLAGWVEPVSGKAAANSEKQQWEKNEQTSSNFPKYNSLPLNRSQLKRQGKCTSKKKQWYQDLASSQTAMLAMESNPSESIAFSTGTQCLLAGLSRMWIHMNNKWLLLFIQKQCLQAPVMVQLPPLAPS